MGDNNPNQIPIKTVSSEDADVLLECYFDPKPNGDFNFHYKDKVKKRDITLGKEFSFVLDQFPDTLWHLVLQQDPDDPKMYGGTWRTGIAPGGKGMAEGTYQAEAGGAGEEEEPSAASAGACS